MWGEWEDYSLFEYFIAITLTTKIQRNIPFKLISLWEAVLNSFVFWLPNPIYSKLLPSFSGWIRKFWKMYPSPSWWFRHWGKQIFKCLYAKVFVYPTFNVPGRVVIKAEILMKLLFRVRVTPGPRPCRLWTASCPPPPPAPWPGGSPRWWPAGSWTMWTLSRTRRTASPSLMSIVTKSARGPTLLCR